MTYLVGYSAHKEDRGALELACQLARADSDSIHAVTVVPQGWPTAVAGDADREFEEWAAQEGEACAEEAQRYLTEAHPDIPSQTSWVTGRSVPQALLDAAERLEATLIVVGSGENVPSGRIDLTSKTSRLLHSAGLPMAIAPRAYRAGAPITRATLAFRGDDEAWSLLERVAEIAQRTGSSLRLVTFAIKRPAMLTARVSGAETMVMEAWRERATAEQHEAVQHLLDMGFAKDNVEAVVAIGRSFGDAMDTLEWGRGDVMVVGSSSTQKLATVFLGSNSSKIVKNSPVPVIVVP